MELRHAAALALVGWTLVIRGFGKTAPKGCDTCAVTLEGQLSVTSGFKTQAECLKAGHDFVADFYAKVRQTGDVVVIPPGKPECREDKSS
jgi:hypothetical protein